MLYNTLMGCLSACPFEWDAGDLALLRQMTREQLRQEGVLALTDLLVDRRISRRELSQYCCRRTCGVEAAISLIERLVQVVALMMLVEELLLGALWLLLRVVWLLRVMWLLLLRVTWLLRVMWLLRVVWLLLLLRV